LDMNYLADMLGIDVHAELWGNASGLPYYLIDCYSFKKAVLEGVACLFLSPKGELDTLNAIKKHIAKIHEIEPLPIVLELDGITARRRKSLIEARIPFIAPNSQLYLPFLGVVLTERYTATTPLKKVLTPSSQLVFFHYLHQDNIELYTGGIADRLGITAMQISRAVKQLKSLGLIAVRKDGVRMVIYSTESRRVLFEKAKPHLLNPVRKKIYTEFDAVANRLPYAGLYALSALTMLNPPTIKTFALFGNTSGLNGTDTMIDNNAQAEVEIWRYAPALLSDQPDMADTLSLITSLQSTDNERVEQAVEEALSKFWG